MLTPMRKAVKRREPTVQIEPETPSSKRLKQEPLTPPTTPSPYSAVKEIFQRGSRSRHFYGREKETKSIEDFIARRLAGSSGALYVSGVPGTGKSAVVSRVFEKQTCIKASINCMSIERPDQTFQTILQAFGHEPVSKNKALDTLHEVLTAPGCKLHLLVLDEVDHIVRGDQEVMFRLFEWSCCTNSNLILIGIANSLDLTDRFLPRLSLNELVPEVLAVKPYSEDEIEDILEHQLKHCNGLVQPDVVRLFSAKIAAQSGDLRRAFDLCGRALQLAEEEWRRLPNHDQATPQAASMKHAIKACQEAFGGNSSVARIRQLNHIQLCCLVVVLIEETRYAKKNLCVHDLWMAYNKFAAKEPSWTSLGLEEFIQVTVALEAYSLLTVSGLCGVRGRTTGDVPLASFSKRRVKIAIQPMDALTAVSKESVKRVLIDNI